MARDSAAFNKAYRELNPDQRRAVDNIYGPILVIAGPGTGKTQLLATRVGKILQSTDASPQNILCLTFTESARTEMQERLARLIGPDGYIVAVHTFHSFGSHVMGSHSDTFKEAFGFRPADDLTRFEILARILERLSGDNPLGRVYDNNFLYLKDIQARISQLRQAGLSPAELAGAVRADLKWCGRSLPLIETSLGHISRIAKGDIPAFAKLNRALKIPGRHGRHKPLGWFVKTHLSEALDDAAEQGTRPLTGWKNTYLTKGGKGQWLFKASRSLNKLSALAEVYQTYTAALREAKVYDYDDMILNVSSKMQTDSDLRAELQEQYQFILVDEYQDTSGAQIHLLELLADNPVSEDKPNLMAVGDDDQAIYGFQGAYASNLLDFLQRWQNVDKIVLKDNYRSPPPLLDFTRSLIKQGEDRLENRYPELDKTLRPFKRGGRRPLRQQFDSAVEQYLWLADDISRQLKQGTAASQIAVIAPKHKQLEALVPFLLDKGLPVAYERREDVLKERHVVELYKLAKVVAHLAAGEIKTANQLMPELLSFEWWGVPAGWLWEINLALVSSSDRPWLELMRRSPRLKLRQVAEWLIETAKLAYSWPLELMLDHLMGPARPTKSFVSPYRSYYFPPQALARSQVAYLRLLSSLVSLRAHLRQYLSRQDLKLVDFIDFVDLRQSADLKIINDHPLVLNHDALMVMTAHKAKGREFELVYIINTDQRTWAEEKGQLNRIALPPNLNIAPAGQAPDDRLRLFYVAVSRARQELILTSFKHNDQGQPTLPLGWLETDECRPLVLEKPAAASPRPNAMALARGLSFDWRMPHFNISSDARWRDLLQPVLENYALSPTHLNAFLNLPDGGPKAFLINQLLRFPRAKTVSASFGEAIHSTWQRLNSYFTRHHRLPGRATAGRWLEEAITDQPVVDLDKAKLRLRGKAALDACYQSGGPFKIGAISERGFAGEGVRLGSVRLSGKIDRLEINQPAKTIFVVDYKTGPSANSWPPAAAKVTSGNSANLHRLHKYRQQLLFYKLLVDGSRSYGGSYYARGAALEYLEPNEDGDLVRLELIYEAPELANLKRLIRVVWQKIINVDLPDTSHYAADYNGVKQFEADLIDGKI